MPLFSTRARRDAFMPVVFALATIFATQHVSAAGTGLVFVSNEKSNTITVLSGDHKVVDTISACGRPRGMHFTADHKGFFVACGDDDTVAVYDIASRKLVKRFRETPDPETFDLHPDGRRLYISNENDSYVSEIDTETGKTLATFETGQEPEGVLVTKDGKYVFATSEAGNLVHVIDIEKRAVIKDLLVGNRPRRLALTPDGKELWVSAELSGIVDIIDVASLTNIGKVEFLPPGMRKEQVSPVDIEMTKDGSTAYVALGRADHVAKIDVKKREVIDYLVVGSRPWGLRLNKDDSLLYVANGLSDDLTIIETASFSSLLSVPVGQVPYGILIDDQ